MATPPQVPQPGAPPQGGASGAAPQPQQGGQGMQAGRMLAAISKLAQTVAQAFAATSPEMEQINQLVQTAARKLVQGQSPPQGQAPPY